MKAGASDKTFTDIRLELDAPFIENFDPVRFAFISSLSQRADSPQHARNASLDEKVRFSIQQYLTDLNEIRDNAIETVKQLAHHFPEQLLTAQQLFDQCRFTELEQSLNQLKRQGLSEQEGITESLAILRDLTNSVNQQAEDSSGLEQTRSFDEMLDQQEQRERLAADYPPVSDSNEGNVPIELLSTKKYLESIKRSNIDKAIDLAINATPKNPGPHNPQMLAIKSLSKIRNLSPQYARRFAAYIETLLWLEISSAKLNK